MLSKEESIKQLESMSPIYVKRYQIGNYKIKHTTEMFSKSQIYLLIEVIYKNG